MLKLRRASVVSVESQDARIARLTVSLEDGVERSAVSYPGMTGPVMPGDDVVVNVEAQDLGLGSGGFDIVHANLSRLEGGGAERDEHAMKLNYTSLQHAVEPIEEGLEAPPEDGLPVAVMALHGQLAPFAYGFSRSAKGRRLGYIQTVGGALPGALSDVVAALLDRGLLTGHITAGASFGGPREALTVEGAIDGARRKLEWDAAVVGPGPGIIGSASALGHGGLAALSNAHSALALGCSVVIVPRVSSGDTRERHRGVSHHTATMLRLMLGDVVAPAPGSDIGEVAQQVQAMASEKVQLVDGAPVEALDAAYREAGLPTTTMGRSIDEDPEFFRYALAAGSVLGRTR